MRAGLRVRLGGMVWGREKGKKEGCGLCKEFVWLEDVRVGRREKSVCVCRVVGCLKFAEGSVEVLASFVGISCAESEKESYGGDKNGFGLCCLG